MSNMRRKMHLFLVIGNVGQHHGAWREPDSGIEQADSVDFHVEVARLAESAKLDAVFIADHLAMLGREAHAPAQHLEPLTLLSALSTYTNSIGLVGSASTTFNEPFNLARQFAALDHLSHGRAGWNIVTSAFGEENFSAEPLPPHAERYARATEFVQVATALWRSWEPDALVMDQASGRYAQTDKVHPIDFTGKYFTVRGPLNIPRPPQSHPVLVQAGTSEDGIAFAAKHAEVVFSAHQGIPAARRYYDEIKRRANALGRNPDQIKVLVGISPILADTRKEADDRRRVLAGLLNTGYVKELVGFQLGGIDLTGFDLDKPVPLAALPAPESINRRQGRFDLYRQLIDKGRNLRELVEIEATAAGLQVVFGAAEDVANELISYFEAGVADGFVLIPPSQRVDGRRLLTEVIPALQERGYAPTTYRGTTLREHLGLPLTGIS